MYRVLFQSADVLLRLFSCCTKTRQLHPAAPNGKSKKKADPVPIDPAAMYESLKNRIAALEEEEEVVEEEERQLRNFGLKSALQHRFRLSSQDIPSSDPVLHHLQGSVNALRELKVVGCHLATQEWVDNHWSLILWKLAGMATLDPESEADVDQRRWCWAETMRQLQYRPRTRTFDCLLSSDRPALNMNIFIPS
ncbi:hypothetical protein F5888DRAFT_1825706 [Russula emetica]|nr:hypothetical protein F5888DRAFT_1825706 [Russula emetica]